MASLTNSVIPHIWSDEILKSLETRPIMASLVDRKSSTISSAAYSNAPIENNTPFHIPDRLGWLVTSEPIRFLPFSTARNSINNMRMPTWEIDLGEGEFENYRGLRRSVDMTAAQALADRIDADLLHAMIKKGFGLEEPIETAGMTISSSEALSQVNYGEYDENSLISVQFSEVCQ